MKLKSKIFCLYAAFVIAYGCLLLLPAPNKAIMQAYRLTSAELRWIDVSVLIIEAIAWFAAFYGYHQLHRYSRFLKGNKDGKHVTRFSTGLLLLALSLPVGTIISSILSLIAAHHLSFTAPTVVTKNYVGVILLLAAFLLINISARGLSEFAKTRPRLRTLNLVVFVVIVLGAIFCSLIVNDHKDLRLLYHMSPEVAILTLAVPYMYTWFLGLFAVAEMHSYSEKVAGVLYRPGWNRLAAGLTAVVLVSILLQYLTTSSDWLTHLTLGWILILLYALLFLLAGAYTVVALGTKKLIKIEEV